MGMFFFLEFLLALNQSSKIFNLKVKEDIESKTIEKIFNTAEVDKDENINIVFNGNLKKFDINRKDDEITIDYDQRTRNEILKCMVTICEKNMEPFKISDRKYDERDDITYFVINN